MTGRWLDPSKLAMLITYRVTACRTRWMSREGSLARRSDNPRSVITRRSNLSRFLNSSLSWRNWQTRTVESRVDEGSNPSDSTNARVVQLAGDDRFKICTVWVRIPPRVPRRFRISSSGCRKFDRSYHSRKPEIRNLKSEILRACSPIGRGD